MKAKTIILYLAKGLGIFALFRVLTGKATRILCYHGGSLGDEHLFNPKLFCRPGLLEQRLEWLRRKGFVSSSLDNLLQPNPTGSTKGVPTVITLDDGWYSTATDLLPQLARHNYQPVIYLATKVFASGGPVVDVCIRYIVWKSPLKLVQISDCHADLDGIYDLSRRRDRELLCAAAERWLALFDGDTVAVHAALEGLAGTLGVPAALLNLKSRRFSYLKHDELLAAARGGCHIELHGHAHQYVKGQSASNLTDIETCRQHIVAAGLPPPHHYCYPSGDHDDAAPAMLTEAGVKTATTCTPGLIYSVSGDQCYFLPRFLDGADVTMIEFEAEMSGVLEFLRGIFRRQDVAQRRLRY